MPSVLSSSIFVCATAIRLGGKRPETMPGVLPKSISTCGQVECISCCSEIRFESLITRVTIGILISGKPKGVDTNRQSCVSACVTEWSTRVKWTKYSNDGGGGSRSSDDRLRAVFLTSAS